MTQWEQPHWSGRPQETGPAPARLKPNAFAKLARWAGHNAALVIIMWLFLAGLGAGFALFSIRLLPQSAPIISIDDHTAAVQADLDREFPGIDRTFYAMVENKNAAYARASAMALVAELQRHPKLFRSAFVPGSGEFYDRYGPLYLPTPELQARITRTLQMQPLFHALSAAPSLGGLAAFVKQIANAVRDGNPPVALADVLEPMADTVEAEIKGKPAQLDWVKLTGLKAVPQSVRWYIIAKPVAGQETAAADAARVIGSKMAGLTWSFPPHTFDGRAARPVQDLGIPALLSLITVLVLLFAGLGDMRQVASVAAALGGTLAVSSAVMAGARPTFDAVTWSVAAAAAAPALVFAIAIAARFGEARARGKSAFTAIMLSAQRGGPRILWFAGIFLALWLAWTPRQIDSLALLAISASIAIVTAALAALTLVPAVLTAGHPPVTTGQFHWLDEAVNLAAGRNLLNLRAMLTLLLMAAAVFCAIFVPAVKFGDPQIGAIAEAPLDTPNAIGAVHILVPPEEVVPLIERLGKMPDVGAVRWLNQFLPVDVTAKQGELKALAALLPPPAAVEAAPVTPDLLAGLDDDLKTIANAEGDAGALSAAAQHLRRALQLFTAGAAPEPAQVSALEDALFAGLGTLSTEADRLAALTAPAAADLEIGLRQHYVSDNGVLRVEVLPRPGLRSLSFAAVMRQAFPHAAGVPIVALARNEVMHHETILALGPGVLLAMLIAAMAARRANRIAVAVVPVPMMLSLSAAYLAVTGSLLDAADLAALTTAIALSQCAALTLALGIVLVPRTEWEMDISFRSALLPLAVSLVAVAPMIVSASPAIVGFAKPASLFLILSILCCALAGMQLVFWMGSEKEASGE